MKIIFLDIDGVLNDNAFWKERHDTLEKKLKENKMSHFEFGVSQINPKKVALLNKITQATGAKIVISSSWRNGKDIKEILKGAGVEAEILGITPNGFTQFYEADYPKGRSYRGCEIQAWIDKNFDWEENYHGEPDGTWKPKRKGLKNFVILDDDGDMLYWHRNNFFQTNTHIGLTEEITDKIIAFLN